PKLEIHLPGAKMKDQFFIFEDVSGYSLQMNRPGKRSKSISLSDSQARIYLDRVLQIVWDSKHRKPAGTSNCGAKNPLYAKVKIGSDSAQICQNATAHVGRIYGISNSFAGKFD
ncbi:MAG: hypothetical protein V4692_05010, partial [Bdellovibrionota bacterium]